MPAGKLAAAERKRLGAYYTPRPLVRAILAEALFDGARTIVDPACGDGRFLTESGLPEQTGVDIDPTTGFVHDDSLRRDWAGQRFDVVVGNPPFLSQLARRTTRGGRSSFGGGPYADAAAEFLALAVGLARPGGRVGLVLPQSLLGARDAAAIRAGVSGAAAMRWMWWSDDTWDDAQVRVWAAVWEVGAVQGPVRRCFGASFDPRPPRHLPEAWTALIAEEQVDAWDGPRLGDIARFSAGFRDQFYGLVGAVDDRPEGSWPKLITSGSIEPGEIRWGQRMTRFAGTSYLHPRVDLDRLAPKIRGWADAQLVPKIVVANQTATIEAAHDADGDWLPCTPVISAVTAQPDLVLGVLASPAATSWVRYHAAGTGLSAGSVRLSPSLLASIPLR